jgi:osmotically-inducible protein OsmY
VWILLSGAAFLPGCATLPAMTDIGFEDDEELAGEIVSRLRNDGLTSRYSFGVTVEGGLCTLNGNVPNRNVSARAESIARSVAGVIDVQNNLLNLSTW